MDAFLRELHVLFESTLQEAIAAYQAKRYSLIRVLRVVTNKEATTIAYSLVERTLQRRMARHLSRAQGYEHRQILSNAEEKTL
ncbi:hypothetical protein M433DRAFT_160114, partial [Acidomyces richmondensis BFW]